MPDLTKSLVGEWAQIPTAMLQGIVESLPRRVEVITAKEGSNLEWNVHEAHVMVIVFVF